MRYGRVGGLVGLALLAGCLVVGPLPGPVVVPPPGPAPEVLSVKEIRAGEVHAQAIYADEIEAKQVRGTVIRSGKLKGGYGHGKVEAPIVVAGTIYAKEIKARLVVAGTIYVHELEVAD